MHVSSIALTNFRSYASLSLKPENGLHVLTGENAAGKTNVLESIFFCAVGRSHRTKHDRELIKMGTDGGRIALKLEKITGEHGIDCKLRREERKQLLIDGSPLTRSGELLGCLRVVMFSPEDLKLVKQGPAERRRFMDMEISQSDKEYYYCLQRYNAALRQRNALLKLEKDETLLLSLTEGLATLGAHIIIKRASFLEKIAAYAKDAQRELSGGKEELSLRYLPAVSYEKGDITAELTALMMGSVERDCMRNGGSTSVGPHRDDFSLTVNGIDARVFASQGQQRTAALALKLAQREHFLKIHDEAPVLLLDDVLSELDEGRQSYLADAMKGLQTFLTCTHLSGIAASAIAKRSDMHVYTVKDANCVHEG